MRKIFDVFPFGFQAELDVLEIRLHEMDPLVDRFVIIESAETYGGSPKPYYLQKAMWSGGRFKEFAHKISRIELPTLEPACTGRTAGRLREAYQRNMIMPFLQEVADETDVIIFSDCDEIPRASAVYEALPRLYAEGVLRLKQRSYYYNVNRLVDYGHDFASRARMAMWKDVEACGSMYGFRMCRKNEEMHVVEEAGWHFGYFGDIEQIKTKVAALSPFLDEYKLFGDRQLANDIVEGKDLHHRRCELPPVFHVKPTDDPRLPAYFLENQWRFPHFTEAYYRQRYKYMLEKHDG